MVLGRGGPAGDDTLLSRRHARVAFDGTTWSVEDLKSTNGTWVDNEPIQGEVHRASMRVIQAGASIFLPLDDVRRFLQYRVRVERGMVLGPALQEVHATITRAALSGDSLLITGESGTGKELAARAYHQAGRHSGGPFVAVNCAAIPQTLAERLLFGARKGAYSGLTHDTDGYVQAANNGTLFLDEVAELDAGVQAKLLRVIDTQEVMELGAVAAKPVRLQVCAATHNLRARVASKQFRDDLYYRIGKPEVRLPPLRERPEEIPWHFAACCKPVEGSQPPALHVSLIVSALMRPWPGNVRELLGEARRAVSRAVGEERRVVEARDLDEWAGMGVEEGSGQDSERSGVPNDAIAEALRLEGGNVTRAARRLGIHRNKVRRWLKKYGIDRGTFGSREDHAG
ncbi:two component, sigma54 specific, transcriptional regulator, Fis family [Chondromyces apiculatus DSM 436]|uniref:Two component, sigma54 specific, transcriptional regulator, Fis family n=1 Tax=Chondromyces apiculatus DSM 436 TaxID=1192034 RepID=A0A017T7Q7_9BACT|nr:two component, sigma54 specific, transcriptional regulator, Fis family [Chondromyces apiculatus DSM 436]